MGTNILFWNCQGIRPKRKELELYLKENVIDVIAPNETFFSKKHNFKILGYDTIRNNRSTGQRECVAFLVKNGPVVNKGSVIFLPRGVGGALQTSKSFPKNQGDHILQLQPRQKNRTQPKTV